MSGITIKVPEATLRRLQREARAAGRSVASRARGLDFNVSTHRPRLRTLMSRYARMDLADASMVVMSELHARSQVLTIDRNDFNIYRRNDRQVIDFIAPKATSRRT